MRTTTDITRSNLGTGDQRREYAERPSVIAAEHDTSCAVNKAMIPTWDDCTCYAHAAVDIPNINTADRPF